MSGVTGAERIKSRQDFDSFVDSYQGLVKQFTGFCSLAISGSYNSDLSKQDFGDIDLIAHINSTKTKRDLKKDLQAFFHQQPTSVIVPFTSPKYHGRRSYNSGEIVTVRYHNSKLGYSVQIDNIIALSADEAEFKKKFLDFPATKQGIILGLVKTAAVETNSAVLFDRLGIGIDATDLLPNQEYEFNLSSNELQLRKVTYIPDTFHQIDKRILWTSRNMRHLETLLYQYDLIQNFDNLLEQTKSVLHNSRSYQRITGVFTSMVSVKSGEVGTKKGAEKTDAIEKIYAAFEG